MGRVTTLAVIEKESAPAVREGGRGRCGLAALPCYLPELIEQPRRSRRSKGRGRCGLGDEVAAQERPPGREPEWSIS